MISPNLSFQNPYFQNNRQCQIAFQGRDLLKLTPLGITRKVRCAVRDVANVIGSGGEGVVYKIPKTDYCVKITGEDIFYFGNWNMNVPISEKVNHVVAISDNGTRMMKIINGEHLNYFNNPEEVYNLPIESYAEILKQIANAKKYGKFFDASPQNIIYDSQKKSLTAIDFTEKDFFDYDKFLPLSLLFKALQDVTPTISALKKNRHLIARLLQTIIEPLSKVEAKEFPIYHDDVDLLLSYGMKMLPQGTSAKKFKDLKKNIFEILKLKEDKIQSVEKEMLLAKKIKTVQRQIDKLFCSD